VLSARTYETPCRRVLKWKVLQSFPWRCQLDVRRLDDAKCRGQPLSAGTSHGGTFTGSQGHGGLLRVPDWAGLIGTALYARRTGFDFHRWRGFYFYSNVETVAGHPASCTVSTGCSFFGPGGAETRCSIYKHYWHAMCGKTI